MNERIKELAEQAGFKLIRENCYDIVSTMSVQEFAELIVKECAKSANDWYQNHDKIHSDPMSYVLAHFGVDE